MSLPGDSIVAEAARSPPTPPCFGDRAAQAA